MHYLFKLIVIAGCIITTHISNAANYIPGRALSGYEPSYFMYAFDDENHIEFKISVKYPLLTPFKIRGDVGKILNGTNQFYFSYTGKYDFFVLSDEPPRDSAPIISRTQNPGFFVTNKRPNASKQSLQKITIGLFHESNGQQITDHETFLVTENAEDFVSRVWDYLAVNFKFKQHTPLFFDGDVTYYLRTRLFCDCQGFGLINGREDDIRIFGGTKQASITDFNGLNFIMNNYANKWLHYGINLRVGTADIDALKNLSVEIQFTYRLFGNLPLRVSYFNGYGKDISTYHIRDEYVGVGLEFW
jgi:outer membrane phospholipase A